MRATPAEEPQRNNWKARHGLVKAAKVAKKAASGTEFLTVAELEALLPLPPRTLRRLLSRPKPTRRPPAGLAALKALRAMPVPATVTEYATATRTNHSAADSKLRRLFKLGLATRTPRRVKLEHPNSLGGYHVIERDVWEYRPVGELGPIEPMDRA